MNKKAQVVIISLWILIILTILAVGIGHRVSMALRLSRYQRDNLKALYLAKAGVNRAIEKLEKDQNNPPAYDSLNETWSTGKDLRGELIFENIELKEGSGEIFTVGSRYSDDKYICMEDEERKININNTNKQLLKQELIELFISKEIFSDGNEAKDLADIIIDWVDEDTAGEGTTDEDKIFKNKPLKVTEELVAILEYFYQTNQNKAEQESREKTQEVYNKIKDLITVYGDGRVNINTVSREVLEIFFPAALKRMQASNTPDLPSEAELKGLLDAIFNFRREDKYFEDVSKIKDNLGLGPTDKKAKIVDFLVAEGLISVTSNNFRIESSGNIKNLSKKITAIYDRGTKKIISWHEN